MTKKTLWGWVKSTAIDDTQLQAKVKKKLIIWKFNFLRDERKCHSKDVSNVNKMVMYKFHGNKFNFRITFSKSCKKTVTFIMNIHTVY